MADKISEITVLLSNLSIGHCLDRVDCFMAPFESNFDIEILIASLAQLIYTFEGKGHGFLARLDNSRFGKYVPDIVTYAVPPHFMFEDESVDDFDAFCETMFRFEAIMSYHRLGIEHFKVSGSNKSNKSDKIFSTIMAFEHSVLLKTDANIIKYPETSFGTIGFVEAFEYNYKKHYDQVEKYVTAVRTSNIGCGESPIWFFIEVDDTVFSNNCPCLLAKPILDVIRKVGFSTLRGIVCYDHEMLYVLSKNFISNFEGFDVYPHLCKMHYYRENGHWWLKNGRCLKYVI